MTYSPTPNSVAWRAIRHLESLDIGAEITTAALSEALNAPTSALWGGLTSALEQKVIFKRQKDKSSPRSPVFWSLTDYSAAEKPPPLSSRSVFGLGAATKAEAPKPKATEFTAGLDSQQVLKAEAATPDATDRDAPATTSPVGGPMGAGQPAAAGPAGELRIAIWSDGVLQVQDPQGRMTTFTADETRQLVEFLDRVLTDRVSA